MPRIQPGQGSGGGGGAVSSVVGQTGAVTGTQIAADMAVRAALVPFWEANETVTTGTVRMTSDGHTITRNSNGTTRASYDATEAALWTVVSGGGGGSVSSANITDATTVGKAVLTAADAPTARTAIGAGTSNVTVGAAGAGAAVALSSTDGSVTNSRTPTAHAATHASGGSDAITVAASQISATGTASASTYLRGDGSWSAPGGGSNATTTTPGLVQLAGDLAGTATAPTVAKIGGVAPAAVATSGSFDDLTNKTSLLTNVTPTNTRYSRAALAACLTGVRDFRIYAQGDSVDSSDTSCGFTPATTFRTNNWLGRMARALGARLGVNARRGFIGVYSYGAFDPQWVAGADWTTFQAWGQWMSYKANAGTSTTLDFTPTDDAGNPVQCDSFTIYSGSTGGGYGNFQWSIDGGTYTTQTIGASPTGALGWTSYTVPAGSVGTHTLHIKAAATGQAAYVLGAEAVNSANPGIRYAIKGNPGEGSLSGGWDSGTMGTVEALTPDLVIPRWGINDYNSQVPLATYQANMQALAAQVQSFTRPADVLWGTWLPIQSALTIPQTSYFAAVDAAAKAGGYGVAHFERSIPSYAVGNPSPLSLYNNTVHPGPTGHGYMGGVLATALNML